MMQQQFKSVLDKLAEEKTLIYQAQRQATYLSLAAVGLIALLGGIGIGAFFL